MRIASSVVAAALGLVGCGTRMHEDPLSDDCLCDAPNPDARLACLFTPPPVPCVTDCVASVAGTGVPGFRDGPVAAAQFREPAGVAVDAAGRVYVADSGNDRIRVIADGQVTTLAGDGVPGWVDGPAASARFRSPSRVAIDADGSVLVADSFNQRIRRIANGQVTTVAGDGELGDDSGPVRSSRFTYPSGLAVDGAGTIFVADETYRVRAIRDGQVTVVAGSGQQAFADGPAASAAFKFWGGGLARDAGGRLYVADAGNYRIRVIDGGQVSTVAGDGAQGVLDGPVAEARFENPMGVALVGDDLYVADDTSRTVRRIRDGQVTTVAGEPGEGCADGPGAIATFSLVVDLAAAPDGRLYIADRTNHRIRVYTP